ncbi:hypothetical protein KCV01_g22872, partial [Aureobasidium melanogenum]
MQEAPTLLGNTHRKQRLARTTRIGPFGDKADTVDVEVGAGRDRHEGAPRFGKPLRILLRPRHGQRPRRLHERTSILIDIANGRAYLVGIDKQDIVEKRPAEPKGLLTDPLHRGTVREQPDLRQRHAPPGFDGAGHRAGVAGLHADDLHLGPYRLHEAGHARRKAATPDGHEDRVEAPLMLAEDFHRHGPLAGDDVGIVKGRHIGHAQPLLQFDGMRVGIAIGLAGQHHLDSRPAEAPRSVHLHPGRRLRQYDGGLHPQACRRPGDPLRMVAGGRRDDPAR